MEKTKETLRTTALAWWNSINGTFKQRDLGLKYYPDRNGLTGREIEEIWRKETQDLSPMEQMLEEEGYVPKGTFKEFNSKPNQKQFPSFEFCKEQKEKAVNTKQFKEFDKSLFRAYISKFSDEDKLKALSCLYMEIPSQLRRKWELGK